MDIFHISLIAATFLCSMVGGFLLAFASVVMPGIRNLGDKEFIKTFQVIDRVIQNRQPVFIIIWAGSIVSLIFAVVLGINAIEGIEFLLLIAALILNLVGVHIPTIIINIPLNNKLQSLEVNVLNEEESKTARNNFEHRWNRWNLIRTFISCITSLILIILLFYF